MERVCDTIGLMSGRQACAILVSHKIAGYGACGVLHTDIYTTVC